MSTKVRRTTNRAPSRWWVLVCVVLGALPFSAALFRLGIDMESPELLRYLLIASPVILALIVIALWIQRPHSTRAAIFYALLLSFVICVPLQSTAYVASLWNLLSWDVFSYNNFPFLMMLLLVWSAVIGGVSGLTFLILRAVRAHHPSPARANITNLNPLVVTSTVSISKS